MSNKRKGPNKRGVCNFSKRVINSFTVSRVEFFIHYMKNKRENLFFAYVVAKAEAIVLKEVKCSVCQEGL